MHFGCVVFYCFAPVFFLIFHWFILVRCKRCIFLPKRECLFFCDLYPIYFFTPRKGNFLHFLHLNPLFLT